jgi:hypothetical protein
LHDYPGTLAQFNEITHRIEADGVMMESFLYFHYHYSFCEYWLAVGDLARAREHATRLYEIAAGPPERTYVALSHWLLAKIAIAEGSLEEARNQLSHAISIVEQGELPLAARRVYATAAELRGESPRPARAAFAGLQHCWSPCRFARFHERTRLSLLRQALVTPRRVSARPAPHRQPSATA